MQHDSYPDDLIRRVLRETRVVAVVGASPNPARPSHDVALFLTRRGYRVYPVNPGHAGEALGEATFVASLDAIPDPVDMVDVFRRSELIGPVVDAAIAMHPRPKVLWMQLGVRNDAEAARAEAAGMTVIMDRCPKIELARLGG